MPKPFAAFDIDGTVFKSSLLEKAVESCIIQGLFSRIPFETIDRQKKRWQSSNNEGVYQSYLTNLVKAFVKEIAGSNVDDFKRITADMIADQRVRRFSFPRQLMQAIQDTHTIVAISGSPTILVEPFLDDLGVNLILGSTFEEAEGAFTGRAIPIGDKKARLRALVESGDVLQEGSIAVGDTVSDKTMLEYATQAVMFNASRTLTNKGVDQGWWRVNEVKDEITALGYNTDIGGYVEVSHEWLIGQLANTSTPQ